MRLRLTNIRRWLSEKWNGPSAPRRPPITIRGRLIDGALATELAPFMTDERAALVRRLRCDEGCTWRGVAGECAERWQTDFGLGQAATHQDTGVALCKLAAAYFGEDWAAEPWSGAATPHNQTFQRTGRAPGSL